MTTTAVTTIIFDLDGTLINEDQVLRAQTDVTAAIFGESDADREQVLQAFFAINSEVSRNKEDESRKGDIAWYLEQVGIRLEKPVTRDEAEKLAIAWKAAYKEATAAMQLYPESINVLQELRDQEYKLILATGGGSKKQQVISSLELDQYFPTVYFAAEVGYQKQDWRFWERLFVKEEIDPRQTFVVGNQVNDDVQCPALLGCQTCLVARSNELQKIDAQAYTGASPIHTVRSLTDILSLLS